MALVDLMTLGFLQPKSEGLFANNPTRAQADLLAGEYRMRSNLMKSTLAGTILCSVAMTVAIAQDANTTTSDIRSAYIESYGQSPDMSVLQVLSQAFQQFDRAGDGIDAEDIEAFDKQQMAQLHSGIASQWLRMDLSGDVKITRDEVEASMGRYRRRSGMTSDAQSKRMNAELKKQVDALFKADADSNNIIEGSELYTPQQEGRDGAVYFERATTFVKALLKADPNSDGKLTETEAAFIASQNLDGVSTEIAQEFAQRQITRSGGVSAKCPKLDVAKGSLSVLLGIYEGTSLSTVTVAGQDDTTHGATLLIEDGTTPITIIATGYGPTIWQVKGATQRIAKMIVGGPARQSSDNKVSAGVVGIDKSKIQFVKAAECLHYFHDVKSSEALMTKAYFQKVSNKAPDVFLGKYQVGVVAVPSGRGATEEVSNADSDELKTKAAVKFFTIGPEGKLLILESGTKNRPIFGAAGDLLTYNTDGVMDFKVSDVVGDAKVEAYNVYPEHAGLMQLVAQGKIEPMRGDRGGWKIKSAIHFPAGLAGALGTSFFLPKGVAMPVGNPGHSKVFSEETASYIDFN